MPRNTFFTARTHFAFALVALCAAPVSAEEWQLSGHAVAIQDSPEDGQELLVDGAAVLQDWHVIPEGVIELPGGAALYGIAGSGGNACAASSFVLWLPEAGAPRLDGPIDSCRGMDGGPGEGGLEWSFDPIPGIPGETYRWTPEAGIVAAAPVDFAPDPALGWEALAGLDGAHPVDAMKVTPIYQALIQDLGADYPDFEARISGLGSGELLGADYAGAACIKESCLSDRAGFYVEAATKQVFAFWHSDDSPDLKFSPPDRNLWPVNAQAFLQENGL